MKKMNKEEIMFIDELRSVWYKYKPSYAIIEPIEDALIELYDMYLKENGYKHIPLV